MSLKPVVITMEQLSEQLLNMSQQEKQLKSSLDLIKHKLHQVEHSLAENDNLRAKIHELMHQSFVHFNTEWKRRTEFYPDIRLRILEKAVDMIAPPTAPKK